MSIALSTLVFFQILFPGIAFRRLYYSEEFSKQYFKESAFAVFISAILPSLLFQTVWYYLAFLTPYRVDLEVFGDLISSKPAPESFNNIRAYSFQIVCYQASMLLVASFSGYIFRKIVRFKKWDREVKLFRFQNNWHYILKWEFYDFPRANISLKQDTVRDIEFVFVDALVETSDGSYLYDGILVDYELSQSGGLDTISLAQTERRKLSNDKKKSKNSQEEIQNSSHYQIEGHLLLLKYHEIKNLNFTYYTLDEAEDNSFSPRKVR